jgi:hypothetical protein
MRRTHLFVSLVLGLLLALVIGGSALASSASITVPPGSRVCLNQQYASYYADAQGTASGAGAQFTVQYGSTNIYQTTNNATAFHATFSTSYGNFPGPGYYRICARNSGTTGINVWMSLDTR